MTRRLYLHIGSGKAGSTTIQRYIHSMDNPALGVLPLRSFGTPNALRLVAACAGPRARPFFVDSRKIMTSEEFINNAYSLWVRATDEVENAPVQNFVSSSEFLIHKVRGRDIRIMRDHMMGVFDEVKIIVYLREQKSFLRSLWAQSVKGPTKSHLTFGEFIDTIEGRRAHWDYQTSLSAWMEVFGRDAIEACVFDRRAFTGGDLLTDFKARLGVPYEVSDGTYQAKENVTPDDDELDRMRYENHIDLARRLGVEPPPQTPGDTLDSAAYDARVLDVVSTGNAWVNVNFLSHASVKLPVRNA
ncbi:MAG: hypothetical protein AAFY35_07930 [Pseudomonadota bacterium]